MWYSRYEREVLQDYSNQIEGVGLNESWGDVSGSTGLFGSPMTIAQEISTRDKKELGITVITGVSNNKVTVKLGSDYKKSDAITRIEQTIIEKSSIHSQYRICCMWGLPPSGN